jgi:chromosome segregation protein
VRLTKLEMHGFKSFADATPMVFEDGVTAIVGPNGCGKSNVSDAVRWVLGEQRARLLRGAKMEEVIFQGSSARRAVNLAEVSLHFENDDGHLPLAFKEVVITRRLSRSGDSEYFLNRAPCRLRDIADLLRGTGLGGDTGVVIEAKMIDALLSDRPDDRRELFEEAAGVGLYRDRRRTTERRLQETAADLQRLDDLISEVQTQVRSLARQRKRAERHGELTTRRYAVEIEVASREMQSWREELQRLEQRVSELRGRFPDIEGEVLAAEAARDAAHGHRAAAEAQRAELSRLVGEQRHQVQQLRGEIAVAEERQRNSLLRRQRAEAEASQGEDHGNRLAEDRAAAATEKLELEGALRKAEDDLRQRELDEAAARQRVADSRHLLESAEETVRELQDRSRREEHEREKAQRELDELRQRLTVLESEHTQLADDIALIMEEAEQVTAQLDETRAASERAAADLDVARRADKEAREQEAEARAELFRADDALTSLSARSHALEALERDRVGLAPAAAQLLKERDRFGEGAVLGPLSDFISADERSATLVERFLGATVNAVLVRDRAAAESIREWHRQSDPGPLLLLPLDAVGNAMSGGEGLATRVAAGDVGLPWVRSLLGQVRPLDEGDAFVDARGAVWLPGSAGGPGPLRRRAEIESLKNALAEAEVARQRASARADSVRESVAATESRLSEASELAAAAVQRVRAVEERLAEVERRRQRTERELQDSAALQQRIVSRVEDLGARITAFAEEASRRAEGLDVARSGIDEAREALVMAERAQDEARELRTQCQIEQAQVAARAQVASDRERRLSAELETASARLEALRQELSVLSSSDAELAERLASWQMDLDARVAALRDGEERLEQAEQGVRASDERLTAVEHSLDAVRHAATAASEELHQAELRFTELTGRRAAIKERLETEWRRPLDEMLGEVLATDADDAQLRGEADQLREQLEQLGPVNALAIEEHEEAMTRLDFLTTQRADLSDAKQQLQQAIREIDATARELFLATFTQVRENFRQIFMTLFGGGDCDLRLENPELPLDCDIEIHASPRGKRTQRIHLLSSGERALVALSLLFGIFLTKPSPFCLLDEVDAPLDDANIGRFVRMLNQFKSKTQFIVITHNPRTTTEAADAVYGVTMQEPGVSSVVSVRMRGASVEVPATEPSGGPERSPSNDALGATADIAG